jgi:hypothetical protein
VRGRDSLIERIRQIRRTTWAAGEPGTVAGDNREHREQDRLGALEDRVEHLEQLLQGLQDSVHRESSRQAKRIGELEARVQPSALGKALSDDARARGL